MAKEGSSKLLAQVQLGVALTDIYTPPVAAGNAVAGTTALWICNTDAADHAVTLRFGTGALTAANSLMEAVVIKANTTYVLNNGQWSVDFKQGQKLQGLADVASKITVSLFGDEVVA